MMTNKSKIKGGIKKMWAMGGTIWITHFSSNKTTT